MEGISEDFNATIVKETPLIEAFLDHAYQQERMLKVLYVIEHLHFIVILLYHHYQ